MTYGRIARINPKKTRSGARRAIGYRRLLDASAAGGAVAHERAEQLVGEVTDLYGAGLERMLAHGGRTRTRSSRTRSPPTT